ncbi:MAG TPA: zinc-ribbon domain containing protein [Chthoniobacteraceae bacterium]|nr:zinc-ribbon domain containing protein [Chthoniobacteraceae bacterium]
MTTRRKSRKSGRVVPYSPGREERIRNLIARGLIDDGSRIPDDAIPAAVELQEPRNTYSPKLFYRDKDFLCRDCGKPQTWTAEQQRWWFETAKGTIYSQVFYCRDCRKKRREQAALHRLASQAGIERKRAKPSVPKKHRNRGKTAG